MSRQHLKTAGSVGFRNFSSASETPKDTTATTSETAAAAGSENADEVIEVDPALLDKIRALIKNSKVVLFMKGNPDEPLCGFSMKMIQLMDANSFDDYTFVDVLKSEDVREGVKQVSEWPTIPQLYIGGEFVGGYDIAQQMHEEGELKTALDKVRE